MSGFSVVRSICGHGIGELFHCAPNIPHYGRNKAVGVMKVGQTFTIEPMINAGVWRDRMWPDGWTAVTADGKRSAQFEHTLLEPGTGLDLYRTGNRTTGGPGGPGSGGPSCSPLAVTK
ncbi:Methionine aminopeptidase [Psidium guajava]|nr:Methionine aminopeptidase [Psidium guajava]